MVLRFRVWPHQRWGEGKVHVFWSAGSILPSTARMRFSFLAVRVHCWLMVGLLSTWTPRFFSEKLLSSQMAPAVWRSVRWFFPRGRTFRFPLLSFMRFLSASFSSLLRSPWMAVQPSGLLNHLTLCLYMYSYWKAFMDHEVRI